MLGRRQKVGSLTHPDLARAPPNKPLKQTAAPRRDRHRFPLARGEYHGLARRHLLPPRFLMRPQLNGGTLGRPIWRPELPSVPKRSLVSSASHIILHTLPIALDHPWLFERSQSDACCPAQPTSPTLTDGVDFFSHRRRTQQPTHIRAA